VPRLRQPEQERELHAAVADFLRLAVRPPTLWTTIGHGGGGLERGRLLARLGLKPGWPDILVLHPIDDSGTLVLGLELKTAIGKQSLVQHGIEAAFAACEANYAVCRSIDDVARALVKAGIPMRAHMAGEQKARAS